MNLNVAPRAANEMIQRDVCTRLLVVSAPSTTVVHSMLLFKKIVMFQSTFYCNDMTSVTLCVSDAG